MRDLVAATILSDSVKYSRKFLASMKEPHEYAAWICNGKQEWGGVPELKVLSAYYQKIFCVVDIQENKIHKFGDENETDGRVYLMYDGIHYNLGTFTSPITKNSRYIFFMKEDYDQ